MKELLPGIFHWTTFHEGIGMDVHSYYLEAADPAVVIDPRVPEEGLEWFDDHARPKHALLTTRHHYRHAGRFEEAFGTEVWCHEAGMHEFTHGEKVTSYRHGDVLPGGIHALAIGSLTPEETALWLPSAGVVALGDSLVRDEHDALAYVPDFLMGDDPEAVKRSLTAAFRRLLEKDFDTLLLAHGDPVVGGAHRALDRFVKTEEALEPEAPRPRP